MLKFAIIRVNDHDENHIEILMTSEVEEDLVSAARNMAGWGRRNRHERRIRKQLERAIHEMHLRTITLP
jgi:uncharacterized protein YbjQ (UPF0145 family)